MANVKGLQRAYKRIRGLAQKSDLAVIEHAVREEIGRFGDDPMLISMLASIIERRAGGQAALELHIRAANAAPENPSIIEDYAACQERLGNDVAASTARFSLYAKGIAAPEAMLGLAWTLLRTRTTLTSDREYFPHDFYRAAMAQSPDPADMGAALNNALSLENRGGDARPVLRDAAIFDPAAAGIWFMLAVKAEMLTSVARRYLNRSMRVTDFPRAEVLHALTCGMGNGSHAEIEAERRHIETSVDALIARPDLRLDIVGNMGGYPYPLFYLAYHGMDDRPLLEKIARMFRQLDPALDWRAPHVDKPRPAGPISIGIIGSFSTLSIYLMIVLIARGLVEDGLSVKLYGYDKFPPGILESFSGIEFEILPPVLMDSAKAIAKSEHDIIMYTDLFMNPRFYILAFMRLARHQVLWPGHPVTSGLTTVDYFISTDTLEREGAEADYTEKLIKLPEMCTIYPSIEPTFDITTLESFGINSASKVYMCAQTLYKVHFDFDDIVVKILEKDKNGIVILFENMTRDTTEPLLPRINALADRFPGRVRLFKRLDISRFLGLMNLVDVLLDTPHFSGGNTSYQAFQMGVPIVTLPGKFMRGRGTYSNYRVMGFEDLVAWDVDQYVELAVRVANDADFRAYCVAQIEARRHRLFDRPEVASEFAKMFREMMGEPVR